MYNVIVFEKSKNRNEKPPKPERGQFIDADTVNQKQLLRIDDWCIKIMRKHEHHFSEEIRPGTIFIKEALKPEDVDVPQIYDFTDLHYEIFRNHYGGWAIRLMRGDKMLIQAAYDKV